MNTKPHRISLAHRDVRAVVCLLYAAGAAVMDQYGSPVTALVFWCVASALLVSLAPAVARPAGKGET